MTIINDNDVFAASSFPDGGYGRRYGRGKFCLFASSWKHDLHHIQDRPAIHLSSDSVCYSFQSIH